MASSELLNLLDCACARCAVRLSSVQKAAGWPISTVLDQNKWVVVVRVACPSGVLVFEDSVTTFPSKHLLAQLMLIAP